MSRHGKDWRQIAAQVWAEGGRPIRVAVAMIFVGLGISAVSLLLRLTDDGAQVPQVEREVVRQPQDAAAARAEEDRWRRQAEEAREIRSRPPEPQTPRYEWERASEAEGAARDRP